MQCHFDQWIVAGQPNHMELDPVDLDAMIPEQFAESLDSLPDKHPVKTRYETIKETRLRAVG